jgi:uncharacterized protein YjiS (DUF1127 family)
MTAISANWPYAAGQTAAFRSILNWTQRQLALRRHRRILYVLSDRELKDIGISRGSIDGVVGDRIGRSGRLR